MAQQRERMKPLEVTAKLAGAICLHQPLHLDAVVAYAVVLRDELPVALTAEDIQPVEIPIQREPHGRFHLCSAGSFDVERSELRYTNRRPPIEQYQTLAGPKLRRCKIKLGANKMYRIPRYLDHVENDTITWFCVGDLVQLRELLQVVHHLGKRRGVGWGKVQQWTVTDAESWGDGFPIVNDGAPLRNLPHDWPGLLNPATAIVNLTYPYWVRATEELCAVPR